MPRLFYGNYDFEHELADPVGWQAPLVVRRLLAERASAWIALADDGDLIWTPEEIPDSFWNELAEAGLPRVRGVTDLGALAMDNIELVPWGWSRRAVALARLTATPSACARSNIGRENTHADGVGVKQSNVTSPPSEAAVRAGNSRAWSFALEQELDVALPGAARLERLDDLATIVTKSAQHWSDRPDEHRWVIKANFGMAARERILGRGVLLSASHQGWLQRRFAADGCVFFEPWLPIREEVGLQFTIPPRVVGTPRLEGITPLLTDAQGGYRGSRFSRDEAVPEHWQPAVEIALRAAERLQQLGYFGPLGIDAAKHELLTGEVVLRPLQDINARFTMGRLALGFRSLLRANETGVWKHLMAEDISTADSSQGRPVRIIPTTQKIVGGQPTQHRSAVVIG